MLKNYNFAERRDQTLMRVLSKVPLTLPVLITLPFAVPTLRLEIMIMTNFIAVLCK